MGIAVRGDVIYVTDENNHRVQKLTTSGKHTESFGSQGSGNGQLNSPRGICIDQDGRVYVSEYSKHRVSVFGADGTFDHIITGNMNSPWGMAFDPEGNLHVANYSSNRITIFSPDGKYITQYGNGYINQPSGIAIDPEGYRIVAEYVEYQQPAYTYNYGYNQQQTATPCGLKIFSSGMSPVSNTITIYRTAGIALDRDGHIYVCDHYNNYVQKY